MTSSGLVLLSFMFHSCHIRTKAVNQRPWYEYDRNKSRTRVEQNRQKGG